MAIGDLKVDFPPVPRKRGEPLWHHAGSAKDGTVSSTTIEASNSSPMMMMKAKVRSVSFADVSEFLEPSKSEKDIASAWYSKEEKNNQVRTVLRNAAEVSRVLETGLALKHEDLFETVGLENLISPRLMRMSKTEIQRHAQSIIFAQTRCDDPALLSRLSKGSSLPSRQRAYERALRLSQF